LHLPVAEDERAGLGNQLELCLLDVRRQSRVDDLGHRVSTLSVISDSTGTSTPSASRTLTCVPPPARPKPGAIFDTSMVHFSGKVPLRTYSCSGRPRESGGRARRSKLSPGGTPRY